MINMAGMTCPECEKQTFFKTTTGRKCSKCGFTMKVPPNNGAGGKGSLCPNCRKYTIFNNKCTKCGAEFFGGQ